MNRELEALILAYEAVSGARDIEAVVSHTLLFPDGTRRTLGLIYPGRFHFGTEQGE